MSTMRNEAAKHTAFFAALERRNPHLARKWLICRHALIKPINHHFTKAERDELLICSRIARG